MVSKSRTVIIVALKKLFDDRHTTLTNSSYVLALPDSYLLQSFDWHYNVHRNIKDMEFCYTGTADLTGQESIELRIINDNFTVLATDYVVDGGVDRCLQIDSSSVKPRDKLGLYCVDCDIDDFFVPETRVLSDNLLFYYDDGLGIISFVDERVSYNSLYTVSCHSTYQKILNAYYTVLGILFFLWLILLGVEWLKRTLWGGWFD